MADDSVTIRTHLSGTGNAQEMRGKEHLAVMVVFINYLTSSGAKTVVFYPLPTTSYVIYHGKIASALSSLGHDVWVCVPHYLLEQNLINDKTVNILGYGEHLGDLATRIYEETDIVNNFWTGKDNPGFLLAYTLSKEFQKLCTEILSDQSFVDNVKNLKADLFVLDSIIFNLNMIVLPYMLDIRYAMIGTMHDVVLSRVPFSPAVTPVPGSEMSDRMTFKQRLQTTITAFIRVTFELFYDSRLVTRFAPDKEYQSITDLVARSEIFLVELDHILDYPRPTLPNTKLTGGSSASPAKPLVGEFQTFVEKSQSGIIVVSFGGSLINVPTNITTKMLAAFKQLKLNVVWRVNITTPDPNQIMTSKWIPQNDLLGHEQTKLFVSHCGKNGQYEALYHGVPILCLPIYGDQMYNVERIRVKQLGLKADMRAVSSDELANLMKQVIYDSKYTDNMKKASHLFRELYKEPRKEAAFWLDHVMTYGGDYMRSAGQTMPLYQFLLLDVIAFIIGVIIFTVWFVCFLVKLIYRYCRSKHEVIKAKQF